MISLALVTAAASLGLILCGYLLGRRDAVRVERKRRGGFIIPQTPKQMVDRWNFPQAPRLYDQENAAEAFPNIAMTDASLRTMAAALDATHEALDPHSRRVPTTAEEYRQRKPGKAAEKGIG